MLKSRTAALFSLVLLLFLLPSGFSHAVGKDSDKMCPKEDDTHKYNKSYVYPKTYTETKDGVSKTITSLWHKECSDKFVIAVCTAAEYCDGGEPEALCFSDGDWGKCKKPSFTTEQVQNAANGEPASLPTAQQLPNTTGAPTGSIFSQLFDPTPIAEQKFPIDNMAPVQSGSGEQAPSNVIQQITSGLEKYFFAPPQFDSTSQLLQQAPTEVNGEQLPYNPVGPVNTMTNPSFDQPPGTVLEACTAWYCQYLNLSQQSSPQANAIGEPFDARTTLYGPGAGGIQGGWETSKPNLSGEFTPKTLDDVRLGKSTYVTLASDPSNFGKYYDLGQVKYQSPINNKVYTLENVTGYVHDSGSAFVGRQDKFDVAVGDFRGWSNENAMSFLTTAKQEYGANGFNEMQRVSGIAGNTSVAQSSGIQVASLGNPFSYGAASDIWQTGTASIAPYTVSNNPWGPIDYAAAVPQQPYLSYEQQQIGIAQDVWNTQVSSIPIADQEPADFSFDRSPVLAQMARDAASQPIPAEQQFGETYPTGEPLMSAQLPQVAQTQQTETPTPSVLDSAVSTVTGWGKSISNWASSWTPDTYATQNQPDVTTAEQQTPTLGERVGNAVQGAGEWLADAVGLNTPLSPPPSGITEANDQPVEIATGNEFDSGRPMIDIESAMPKYEGLTPEEIQKNIDAEVQELRNTITPEDMKILVAAYSDIVPQDAFGFLPTDVTPDTKTAPEVAANESDQTSPQKTTTCLSESCVGGELGDRRAQPLTPEQEELKKQIADAQAKKEGLQSKLDALKDPNATKLVAQMNRGLELLAKNSSPSKEDLTEMKAGRNAVGQLQQMARDAGDEGLAKRLGSLNTQLNNLSGQASQLGKIVDKEYGGSYTSAYFKGEPKLTELMSARDNAVTTGNDLAKTINTASLSQGISSARADLNGSISQLNSQIAGYNLAVNQSFAQQENLPRIPDMWAGASSIVAYTPDWNVAANTASQHQSLGYGWEPYVNIDRFAEFGQVPPQTLAEFAASQQIPDALQTGETYPAGVEIPSTAGTQVAQQPLGAETPAQAGPSTMASETGGLAEPQQIVEGTPVQNVVAAPAVTQSDVDNALKLAYQERANAESELQKSQAVDQKLNLTTPSIELQRDQRRVDDINERISELETYSQTGKLSQEATARIESAKLGQGTASAAIDGVVDQWTKAHENAAEALKKVTTGDPVAIVQAPAAAVNWATYGLAAGLGDSVKKIGEGLGIEGFRDTPQGQISALVNPEKRNEDVFNSTVVVGTVVAPFGTGALKSAFGITGDAVADATAVARVMTRDSAGFVESVEQTVVVRPNPAELAVDTRPQVAVNSNPAEFRGTPANDVLPQARDIAVGESPLAPPEAPPRVAPPTSADSNVLPFRNSEPVAPAVEAPPVEAPPSAPATRPSGLDAFRESPPGADLAERFVAVRKEAEALGEIRTPGAQVARADFIKEAEAIQTELKALRQTNDTGSLRQLDEQLQQFKTNVEHQAKPSSWENLQTGLSDLKNTASDGIAKAWNDFKGLFGKNEVVTPEVPGATDSAAWTGRGTVPDLSVKADPIPSPRQLELSLNEPVQPPPTVRPTTEAIQQELPLSRAPVEKQLELPLQQPTTPSLFQRLWDEYWPWSSKGTVDATPASPVVETTVSKPAVEPRQLDLPLGEQPQQLQLPLNEPVRPVIEPQQLALPLEQGQQLRLPLNEPLQPVPPVPAAWWSPAGWDLPTLHVSPPLGVGGTVIAGLGVASWIAPTGGSNQTLPTANETFWNYVYEGTGGGGGGTTPPSGTPPSGSEPPTGVATNLNPNSPAAEVTPVTSGDTTLPSGPISMPPTDTSSNGLTSCGDGTDPNTCIPRVEEAQPKVVKDVTPPPQQPPVVEPPKKTEETTVPPPKKDEKVVTPPDVKTPNPVPPPTTPTPQPSGLSGAMKGVGNFLGGLGAGLLRAFGFGQPQPPPTQQPTRPQCTNQPQQPPPTACTSGTWRAIYSASCIVGWQCTPATATTTATSTQ